MPVPAASKRNQAPSRAPFYKRSQPAFGHQINSGSPHRSAGDRRSRTFAKILLLSPDTLADNGRLMTALRAGRNSTVGQVTSPSALYGRYRWRQPALSLLTVGYLAPQPVRARRRLGDRRKHPPTPLFIWGVRSRQGTATTRGRQLCLTVVPGNAGQICLHRGIHQRLH